jgi:hypothetical protein
MALLAAAVLGAVLLIVADFTTLRGVRAITADLAHVSAGAEHHHALLIVGALALPTSVWAAIGRSRLAALLLVIGGAVSAYVILAVDLPSLGRVAPYDTLFASVTATRGSAVYLEIAGAVLLLVSGLAQLLMPSRPRSATAAAPDRPRAQRARNAQPAG